MAPNLESLTISGTSAMVEDYVTGSDIKSLSLDFGDNVKDKFLEDVLSKSPILEDLFLYKTINISSNHLKILTVSHCENLKNCKINTPNLQTLEYKGKAVVTGISLVSAPRWRIHLYDKSLDLFYLNFLLGANKIKDLTLSVERDSKVRHLHTEMHKQ